MTQPMTAIVSAIKIAKHNLKFFQDNYQKQLKIKMTVDAFNKSQEPTNWKVLN